jgi:hypothetical protein
MLCLDYPKFTIVGVSMFFHLLHASSIDTKVTCKKFLKSIRVVPRSRTTLTPNCPRRSPIPNYLKAAIFFE